jgi:uncharacterized protein (DUF1697 family)
MLRFVAFLRAINVGTRKVGKQRLQEAFIALGFQNVSTFGQSGNVIFETNETNTDEMMDTLSCALSNSLGFEVTVFLRTIPELKRMIEVQPFKKENELDASYLVTMLEKPPKYFPMQLPLTVPKSSARIISIEGTEVFSETHGGGEGGLPNQYLESKLKLKATTRNMNVIKEIVLRFGENILNQ